MVGERRVSVVSETLLAGASAGQAPGDVGRSGSGSPAGLIPSTVRARAAATMTLDETLRAGPGVTRQTGIAARGTRTWSVTFRRGTWTYLCQLHPDSMRATFRAA